jgi:hypothetical protein
VNIPGSKGKPPPAKRVHIKNKGDGQMTSKETTETRVTFSLWAVISLIIVLFISFAAYAFTCLADHSNRLTKTETQFEFIAKKLDSIDQRLLKHTEEKQR